MVLLSKFKFQRGRSNRFKYSGACLKFIKPGEMSVNQLTNHEHCLYFPLSFHAASAEMRVIGKLGS